ncbi:MAG: hypothetical protein J1F39_06530 [Clostridiales bacterium]|nr:hypothetical protein [Clostridiales bacterium]
MNSDKELYYLDFDKLFENYADKYYAEHEDEYDSPDDFARDLDLVYSTWATSPQEALGGIAPAAFFDNIPADELIDILKGSCAGDGNPSSLLFDRIAEEPSLMGELCSLARGTADEKLLTVTLSLIAELGGGTNEFYLDMLERTDVDSCVKDMCIETLCSRAEDVKGILIERAEKTDDVGMIELYAEVLSYCPLGDDKILKILVTLLNLDPNTAYIAGLMGRYGDDRAAQYLYPLLDSCDYATFIEVRNAIEELGGNVDDNYRDFSDDPLYALLKGKKK